jgi:hypothetical protein
MNGAGRPHTHARHAEAGEHVLGIEGAVAVAKRVPHTERSGGRWPVLGAPQGHCRREDARATKEKAHEGASSLTGGSGTSSRRDCRARRWCRSVDAPGFRA